MLRVDYENTQMLLNPSFKFLIDARGLLLIGRKSLAEVYMCLKQNVVFIRQLGTAQYLWLVRDRKYSIRDKDFFLTVWIRDKKFF